MRYILYREWDLSDEDVQDGAEDDEEHEEEEAEREEGVLRALDGEVHDFDGSVKVVRDSNIARDGMVQRTA